MNARCLAVAAAALLAACDGRSLPTSAVPETGAAASVGVAGGNQAPTARATVQRDSLWEGTPLRFSGARSTDPNGDPLTYTWDFGDGTSGLGRRTTHGYADNGTYEVTLTVRDGRGGTGSVTVSVTIGNVKPRAGALTVPADVDEGDAFILSLNNPTDRGSADEAAGFTYSFDCGDGNWTPWGAANSQVCPGRGSGNVTVRGKVRDKDGRSSSIRSQEVEIDNLPPVIQRAEVVRQGPRTFVVFVRYTDAPGDRQSAVRVNWGDGSWQRVTQVEAGEDQDFRKRYSGSNTGPVQITVVVRDKDGDASTETITVQLQ